MVTGKNQREEGWKSLKGKKGALNGGSFERELKSFQKGWSPPRAPACLEPQATYVEAMLFWGDDVLVSADSTALHFLALYLFSKTSSGFFAKDRKTWQKTHPSFRCPVLLEAPTWVCPVQLTISLCSSGYLLLWYVSYSFSWFCRAWKWPRAMVQVFSSLLPLQRMHLAWWIFSHASTDSLWQKCSEPRFSEDLEEKSQNLAFS